MLSLIISTNATFQKIPVSSEKIRHYKRYQQISVVDVICLGLCYQNRHLFTRPIMYHPSTRLLSLYCGLSTFKDPGIDKSKL